MIKELTFDMKLRHLDAQIEAVERELVDDEVLIEEIRNELGINI